MQYNNILYHKIILNFYINIKDNRVCYEKSGGIIYVTRTNVTFKLYLLNHTTESLLI